MTIHQTVQDQIDDVIADAARNGGSYEERGMALVAYALLRIAVAVEKHAEAVARAKTEVYAPTFVAGGVRETLQSGPQG